MNLWRKPVPKPDGMYIAWTDELEEKGSGSPKLFLNRSQCIDFLERHGGSYLVVFNAAGSIVHKVRKK
jgi:hypothetical protein